MPDPAFQSSNLPIFQSSNLPPFHLFDEAFLRKLEQLALLSRRAMAGQLQGERRSPKRGQSVEFADFRPYAMGDDLRRIDWNAYARLERFFIKLFVEEEDLTVHLLVDASRSMDWGAPNKLHYAVRAAAALGYVALVGLDRVTVTAFGQIAGNQGLHHKSQIADYKSQMADRMPAEGNPVAGSQTFPPRRGKQQAMALFAFLPALALPSPPRPCSKPPSSGAPLPSLLFPCSKPPSPGASLPSPPSLHLRTYAAAATRPGPLVLFSDLLGEGWPDGLRALVARGFEVTVLHILSPDEVNPELAGDLKLLDVETGTDVEITADPDLLQRYRDGLAAWQEELRQFCNARAMHYVPVETSMPFEELLFAVLRQRGVLK